MSVEVKSFGKTKDGKEVSLYTIKNAKGMEAVLTDFGAILVSLKVPNDKGEVKDVVLGFDNVAQYESNPNFFGGTIGPSANRIAGCRFTIDGTEYRLKDNDGGNNLHSDFDLGYHKQLFNAELVDNGVKFTVKTEDGLMGFPGNITASVTYTLSDDNELKLEYEGVSDKATLFNMTNHSYFALGGHEAGSRALLDTVLMINASKATEVRAGLIPTGKICDIKGTAMDFTSPKKIGQDIDSDWEQMKLGNGYDHNFVIDNYDGTLRLVARASYDGRTMEVYSDLPGLQFYSGNGLSPFEAKDGAKYGDRGGFCLETQYFPNSVNEPAFESPVKKAGEKYHTVTIYKFV